MTFVGTRPEVPKYVEKYSEEMRATLLLPAGVTSEASIHFKNEAEMTRFIMSLKVCFYTVIITIVMKIVSPESVGFMDFIKSITPASSGQYWYFSAYFALFFLTPFLNVLINELDKKRLKLLIFTIVIVFSVIPTFRHTDPFLTGKGYSCIWLVCMYLLVYCIVDI